jgi:hypothetical protein
MKFWNYKSLRCSNSLLRTSFFIHFILNSLTPNKYQYCIKFLTLSWKIEEKPMSFAHSRSPDAADFRRCISLTFSRIKGNTAGNNLQTYSNCGSLTALALMSFLPMTLIDANHDHVAAWMLKPLKVAWLSTVRKPTNPLW